MGDFLSRLVDRALDVAPPALHRRIPSLFERGPDPALPTGPGEARAELPEEETPSLRDAPRIKSQAVTDAPVVDPLPIRRGHRGEPAHPAGARESLGFETIRALEPATLRRRLAQRPAPVPEPEETAAPPARPERYSAEGARITPVGQPAVTAEAQATRPRVPAAAPAVRENDRPSVRGQSEIFEPAPAPLPRDRGRLLQTPTPEGHPPFVPSRRAALRSALSFERGKPSRPVLPAAQPPGSRAASPPPPAVQVTIGRIEVRAVSPPSTPSIAPGKPAGPRLTLEDYLRSRDGGER